MKWLLNLVLSLLLVGAAVTVAVWLYKTRPRPQKRARSDAGALVQIMDARPGTHRVTVVGMGTVIPARELVVRPEVSGRLVDVHPQLMPGGLFDAGATIARIDPRDYQFLLAARQAEEERARLELEVEQGRQKVAHRELELLESELQESALHRELALRQPHLRNAQAALAAARSGVEKARLDLERTDIQVPFNCVVRDESAEIGQLVSPQTNLATMVGTDSFWVQVSIPVDRLVWFRQPSPSGSPGARARILQETTGEVQIERSGQVIHVLGDVDPVGRMARALIEIDDPLGLRSDAPQGQLPLLLGAYVRVEIEGDELDNVCRVPRSAIHDGSKIWIADETDRLDIRDVAIAWRDAESVLVSEGLERGDRIVTSTIPIPMRGMKLRQASDLAPAAGHDSPEQWISPAAAVNGASEPAPAAQRGSAAAERISPATVGGASVLTPRVQRGSAAGRGSTEEAETRR
ncbi:MAG: efflux RND transporter periplasmic adaptor subunit [Planctomycetes bacterium]|nr:efflux RND transporter periplasmic adaptor subunit [Planctomycetota bacterium]